MDWTPIVTTAVGALAGIGGAAVSGVFSDRSADAERTARASETERDRQTRRSDRVYEERKAAYRNLLAATQRHTDFLYAMIWTPPSGPEEEPVFHQTLVARVEADRDAMRSAVFEVALVGSDEVIKIADELLSLSRKIESQLARTLTKYRFGLTDPETMVGAINTALEAIPAKEWGAVIAQLEIAVRSDIRHFAD